MKRLSATITGLLMMSLSAHAAPVCADVKGTAKDVIFLAAPNCDIAKDISDVVNEISATFGGPSVTLIIGGASDNASFDLGHLIELPYQMIFYGRYGTEYPVPRMSVVTSAAHEYGHAIFHERFKKEFPHFADMVAKLAKVSDVKEAKARGQATQEQLNQAMTDLTKTPSYAEFSKYFSAYSEFFADVIAVYNMQDKSAMLSALYYQQMSDTDFAFIRMRDFAPKPTERYEAMLSEEHAKLAIARTYVGESLWPKDKLQAKQYEEKILSAIMAVAKVDVTTGKSPEWKEMNDNLIAELKKK